MDINITIKNRKERYLVGETLVGAVHLTVPEKGGPSLGDIRVSLTGIGKVKWVESVGTPYYGLEGNLHYDTIVYHRESLKPEEVGEFCLNILPKIFTIFVYVFRHQDCGAPGTQVHHRAYFFYNSGRVSLLIKGGYFHLETKTCFKLTQPTPPFNDDQHYGQHSVLG